ncbi:MAG: type II toxin-antitoxin system VapC family toxin [Haloechinothrix sp.]
MIVVDTSVWIDLFRGAKVAHVDYMREQLHSEVGEDFALTDIVLTEILQGLPENEVDMVERQMLEFPVLRLNGLEDFRRAAALYRAARGRGVTIRRTTDCLIAAVCIRDEVPLLHRDVDFDRLAQHSELKIAEVQQ